MIIEIKIPSPGESISEVELATWFVEDGDYVVKDQEVGEVESEKATLPLIAENAGKIELLASPGDTLKVGAIACKIDTSLKAEKRSQSEENKDDNGDNTDVKEEAPDNKEVKESVEAHQKVQKKPSMASPSAEKAKATPLARKLMEEANLNIDDIINGLRKITSDDVRKVTGIASASETSFETSVASREEQRSKMSQLRKKISARLVAVNNETAMLTTFNEADMSTGMAMRKKYQDRLIETHGGKLGFMSLFTKAVTLALQQFPNVNSYLDGDEVIRPEYCDGRNCSAD